MLKSQPDSYSLVSMNSHHVSTGLLSIMAYWKHSKCIEHLKLTSTACKYESGLNQFKS